MICIQCYRYVEETNQHNILVIYIVFFSLHQAFARTCLIYFNVWPQVKLLSCSLHINNFLLLGNLNLFRRNVFASDAQMIRKALSQPQQVLWIGLRVLDVFGWEKNLYVQKFMRNVRARQSLDLMKVYLFIIHLLIID